MFKKKKSFALLARIGNWWYSEGHVICSGQEHFFEHFSSEHCETHTAYKIVLPALNPQYQSWWYILQFVKHLRTCFPLCMHKKHFPRLELRTFIKVKTFLRWDVRKLVTTVLKCSQHKYILKAKDLSILLNQSLNYNCRANFHLLNITLNTVSQQGLTRGPAISLLAAFSAVHCLRSSDRSSHCAEQSITRTIIALNPNSCTSTLKEIWARVQPHQHTKDAEM